MTTVVFTTKQPKFYKRYIGDAFSDFLAAASTSNSAAESIGLVPVFVPRKCRISGAGFTVTANQAGKCVIALYKDNGETPVAGALIVQSVAAGQDVKQFKNILSFSANVIVEAGLYWIGLYMEAANVTYLRVPDSFKRADGLADFSLATGTGIPYTFDSTGNAGLAESYYCAAMFLVVEEWF